MADLSHNADTGGAWNQVIAAYRQACEFEQRGHTAAALRVLESRVKTGLADLVRNGSLTPDALAEKLPTEFLQQWDNVAVRIAAERKRTAHESSPEPMNIPFDNISGMIDSVQHLQTRSFR